MPESMDVQLARIEERLNAMSESWDRHTHQDMEQFTALNDKLEDLDVKVDMLIIAKAQNDGEARSLKRVAGFISALVAAIVTGIVSALNLYVG